MTQHGDFSQDLTGLYNQNGGVAPNQICGQGLVTKLLRNKKIGGKGGAPLSQNALVFGHDAKMCMSPVHGGGKPKKVKYKSNVYENMDQASIGTGSCSSDDIFSETTSTTASSLNAATIDDLQSPVFVAQFDPVQVTSTEIGRTDGVVEQSPPGHHAIDSTTSSCNNNSNGLGPRKTVSSWSASLPVVEEEDSQSEQGSQPHLLVQRNEQIMQQQQGHPGTWHNAQGIRVRNFDQQGAVGISLLEQNEQTDTYEAMSSSPQQSQQEIEPMTHSIIKRKEKLPKLSKQQMMREAVDRRIQQAMDEQMRQVEQDERQQSTNHHNHRKLDIFDTPFSSGFCDRNQSEESSSASFGSFPHQPSASASPISRFPKSSIQHCLPDTHHPPEPDVLYSMQNMLTQQQMTLKEMSLQNYHYRRELTECHEMFAKWRKEREEQQATIHELVKEKEAHASEAKFLRKEMSSIRHELEALRKETILHAQENPSIQNQQQSPNKRERATSTTDHLTLAQENPSSQNQQQQPQQQMPYKRERRTTSTSDHVHAEENPSAQNQQQQSPHKRERRTTPTSDNNLPRAPPPPSKSKDYIKHGASIPHNASGYATPTKQHGSSTSNKPLVSGLKTSSTKATSAKKPQRSVKFHDPPKSKEWTLFPGHLHDDRMNPSVVAEGYNINQYTSLCTGGADQVAESRQDAEESRATHGFTQEPTATQKSSSSQSTARKRSAAPMVKPAHVSNEGGADSEHRYQQQNNNQNEVASVYKNRLETIQKHRQERSGKDARSKSAVKGGECTTTDGTGRSRTRSREQQTPERRRRRSVTLPRDE